MTHEYMIQANKEIEESIQKGRKYLDELPDNAGIVSAHMEYALRSIRRYRGLLYSSIPHLK